LFRKGPNGEPLTQLAAELRRPVDLNEVMSLADAKLKRLAAGEPLLPSDVGRQVPGMRFASIVRHENWSVTQQKMQGGLGKKGIMRID